MISKQNSSGYFYDDFYRRRSTEKSAFGPEPEKILRLHTLIESRRGKAIDLGCGDGRNSLFLARCGYNVTALDNSRTAIEKLAEKAKAEGIGKFLKPICGDFRDFKMAENEYDLSVAITLFDHLPYNDVEPSFVKTVEGMAKGGTLIAKAHTVKDPGNRNDPENASELAHMVKHYFKPKEFYELASKYLYVVNYSEVSELDTTHGKPHRHHFAILKGKKI